MDLPDFDAVGGIDFDFSLDGFDLIDEGCPTRTRIYSRPRVMRHQEVAYEYAEQFARELTLDNETDTFAFVSGNFVFGDFVEALVDLGRLSVRRMGIQTLSLNDENIDSIRNIIEWERVERLDMAVSNYWYAHERKPGGLVGYLFDELDVDGMELRVGFCSTHAKIWTIETRAGNYLTISGSANLRSSHNIEQVFITTDPGMYEFCTVFLDDDMLDAYNVVNADARKTRTVRGGNLWQAVARTAAAGTEAAGAVGAAAPATGANHGLSANANAAPVRKGDGIAGTARCRSKAGDDG